MGLIACSGRPAGPIAPNDDAAAGGPGGSAGAGSGAPSFVSGNAEPGPLVQGCAVAETVAAPTPVDVIIAVDSSPSMADDAANVQANLNRLATTLANAGLDYRLVLIALHYEGPGNATKMCVPAPLGGATCGSSNPPLFRHVVHTVESNNMLRVILWTLDGTSSPGAPWANALRRDALKVFLPVTDDDSIPGPNAWDGISASQFQAELGVKASGNFGAATAPRYIFFPIVGAPAYPAESPKCGGNAMNTGAEYVDLAKRTSGKWFSICATDFAPVFDEVATRITERVACEIRLPVPPAGSTLDRSRVNVALTPGGGARELIPHDSTKPCDEGADGWQYAADGESILLCGAACERTRTDATAKLIVELGCHTRAR